MNFWKFWTCLCLLIASLTIGCGRSSPVKLPDGGIPADYFYPPKPPPQETIYPSVPVDPVENLNKDIEFLNQQQREAP